MKKAIPGEESPRSYRTLPQFDLAAVLVAACLLVQCGTSPARTDGIPSPPEPDLTLGQVATRAGMFAGVAVPADLTDPRMELVPVHFNSVTAENAMKWGELSRELGDYDFIASDALLAFAEIHGLRVRGHTLIWGASTDQGYPPDLPEKIDAADDPEEFTRQALHEHVSTVVGRYAGRVETWDVVNEPLAQFGGGFDRNIFYEAMGAAYISEAFFAARAADPGARLVLNEYFLAYSDAKAGAFIDLVSTLLDQGVPIDGVGIQGHVYIAEPRPGELEGYLAEFASLGLEIEFTELDVLKLAMLNRLARGEDLFEAQADVYRDITRACVQTPACRGITVWGIDDGHTWFDTVSPFTLFAPNNPLIIDRSLKPKPAYHLMMSEFAERADRSRGTKSLAVDAYRGNVATLR